MGIFKSKWRPIDTAPRDGTRILVWDGFAHSCVNFRLKPDGSSTWEVSHERNYDGSITLQSTKRTLTHWQPLPPPPDA
jgi:hypothetical protein